MIIVVVVSHLRLFMWSFHTFCTFLRCFTGFVIFIALYRSLVRLRLSPCTYDRSSQERRHITRHGNNNSNGNNIITNIGILQSNKSSLWWFGFAQCDRLLSCSALVSARNDMIFLLFSRIYLLLQMKEKNVADVFFICFKCDKHLTVCWNLLSILFVGIFMSCCWRGENRTQCKKSEMKEKDHTFRWRYWRHCQPLISINHIESAITLR